MFYKKAIACLALCAAVVGCSTPSGTSFPTLSEMQALPTSNEAMIAFNSSGDVHCTRLYLGVHREGDSQNTVIQTDRYYDSATSETAVAVVPAGKISISGAYCDHIRYVPHKLPMIGLWFGEIEIKPGEFVYIGNLNVEEMVFDSYQSLMHKFWMGDRKLAFYSYELQDDSAGARESFRFTAPELENKMVTRIPPRFLDKELYKEAVQQAYGSNPETGERPTEEEAAQKLRAYLKVVIAEALVNHQKQNGPEQKNEEPAS